MGFCLTPAFADESGDDMEIQDDNFGGSYQYTWIPCFSFTLTNSGGASYTTYNGYRYFTSTTNWIMDASINLPSGAYLHIARLYYYDNDLSNFTWNIMRYSPGDNNFTTFDYGVTSGRPGFSSMALYPNHTIQNGTGMYLVRISAGNNGPDLRFMGVRLYWRRQIRTGLSHPFNDIGGLSQNFQDSIAALYQSGITTGTSPTTYSPNNPVTRAQMAAFLARALGLHWAYPY